MEDAFVWLFGNAAVSAVHRVIAGIGVPVTTLDDCVPQCVCSLERNACKVLAIIERFLTDARHAVGNRDARQATAMPKRRISNACYAVWDCDACKVAAAAERRIINARHATIRGNNAILTTNNKRFRFCFDNAIAHRMVNRVALINSEASQAGATGERRIANGCHTVGNRDARQAGATVECITSNSRDAVRNRNVHKTCATGERRSTNVRHATIRGNNAVITTNNKRFQFCVDNAIAHRVVNRVALINSEASQAGATGERRIANVCHTVGNRDACQATAKPKRRIANDRHAVGNRDARQTTAKRKRIIANVCHTVGNRDARQTTAKRKRIIANVRYAVGNRDARQATANPKRRIANARYAVGDCDACKVDAKRKRRIANARYAVGDYDIFAITIIFFQVVQCSDLEIVLVALCKNGAWQATKELFAVIALH